MVFHRSPQDAQVIFHAVAVGVLPRVTRRLDTEERRTIASGSVFVWEERGPNPEATGVSASVKRLSVVSHTRLVARHRKMDRWQEASFLVSTRVHDLTDFAQMGS